MISTSMPQGDTPKKRRSFRLSKIILAVIVLVACVSLYQNYKYASKLKSIQGSQVSLQDQIQSTLDKVGKVIILPNNETPTIATVSDLSKLKDQPFFVNAAIGDQVIIYTKSKKAILWRPSTNKIVEVAPINIDSSQTASVGDSGVDEQISEPTVTPSSSPSPSTKPKR